MINSTLSSISTGYEEDSLASGERDAGMEMEGEGEYVDIEGEDVSVLDCSLNFRIPGMAQFIQITFQSGDQILSYTERQKKHHFFRATLTKIHRIKLTIFGSRYVFRLLLFFHKSLFFPLAVINSINANHVHVSH